MPPDPTPTRADDQEREALAKLLRDESCIGSRSNPILERGACLAIADAILAAGFRRAPEPVRETEPHNDKATHRCRICGALWWRGYVHPVGDSWSLRSPTCGKCCDNVAMGDQIEPLAQPEPVRDPCVGGNPMCPCQDGDTCNYRDGADGTTAMPIPRSPPEPQQQGGEGKRCAHGVFNTHRCRECEEGITSEEATAWLAKRAAPAQAAPAGVTEDDITEAQSEAFRCEFNRGITFDGKPFLYANDVTMRSIQAAIAAALAAAGK